MTAATSPMQPGFFDGGSFETNVNPKPGTLRVQLERVVEPKVPRWRWLGKQLVRLGVSSAEHERFILERRIAYQTRGFDGPHIVPADSTFRSDLASVPSLFTWLVPRTGRHLPAALLHDGLVHNPGEPASYVGPTVTRVEADRIFREAMADLGTGRVRRWLMWAAVSLATVVSGVAAGSGKPRISLRNWYYRIAALGSLATVAVLGTLATLDIFDRWDGVFWIPERRDGIEFLYGAAGAVLIPALFSILWWRLWPAGIIAGIALGVLLHVTVVLCALTILFQAVEFLARWKRRAPVPGAEAPSAAGASAAAQPQT